MATERTPARQTCTEHCTGCQRHFHGLGAFDRHRSEGECLNPVSVVAEKTGLPALQVWTENGSCDHVKGCWDDGKRVRWEEPVTVWQVYATEEQRESLRRLQGSNSQESGEVTASAHRLVLQGALL